jgi:sterol desaturase/sphingolipid hydroxylase (fatty acid hydroxylase superfamily)
VLGELVALQGKFWILQFSAVMMFVTLCFIEGVVTKRAISEKPPRELVTDSIYWFLSPYFRMLSKLVLAALLIMFAALIGHEDTPSLLQGFGPLSRQPMPLIVLEALVLSDLSSYWLHRLMHRVPALWRFHAIHHSPKTVRWSTIGRVHPVNELLNYLFGVVPCLAIGLPFNAVLAMIPVFMWWAVAVHSDIKFDNGPLRAVFVSPIFHRWHHTHSHEGGDKNFANVFSLWDWLFGSYYMPPDAKPEVFGLDEDTVPESYLGQLLHPFGVTPKPTPAQTPPAGATKPAPGAHLSGGYHAADL